jgi:hypothetical protein
MPRPTIKPGIPTTRINFKLPEPEAERYREFARETARPGEVPSVSDMIRRVVGDAIEEHEDGRVSRAKAATTR